MNVGSTIAGCFVGGMLVLSAPSVMAATVSSQLSEAFDTLDTLAAELDGRLGELGVPPQPDGPERPQSDDSESDDSACPVRVAGFVPEDTEEMSVSCVSRKEIVARTGALKARFEESARTITGINGEMPAFREGVVDVRVCTENLTKDITAAVVRLESLDIGTDCRAIAELGPCIDRLREDTDNKLDVATSSVALERLAAELERVRSMNEQLIAVEQALHRGVSKRRRLLQELSEFGQELEQKEDSCG